MRMFENYPDVVTVKELCQMLKIGRNTAYLLLQTNQILSIQIGRQHRISKESVKIFVQKNLDEITKQ